MSNTNCLNEVQEQKLRSIITDAERNIRFRCRPKFLHDEIVAGVSNFLEKTANFFIDSDDISIYYGHCDNGRKIKFKKCKNFEIALQYSKHGAKNKYTLVIDTYPVCRKLWKTLDRMIGVKSSWSSQETMKMICSVGNQFTVEFVGYGAYLNERNSGNASFQITHQRDSEGYIEGTPNVFATVNADAKRIYMFANGVPSVRNSQGSIIL